MFSGVCPHRDIHSLLAGVPAVTASLSVAQSAENTPRTRPFREIISQTELTDKHLKKEITRLIIKCHI